MNAAAYIRVSSKGQDHAMQRLAVERAAAARGDAVCEWFAEKRTAKTLDRPELARLLGQLDAGTLPRRLYVFKLDRLTRTGIRDTLGLVERFKAAGVELVTVADGFDLAGPMAELVIAVMAWAARMELHTRAERIAARRELAEERGEAWGRPSKLTSGDRAAILARLQAGATVREVAAALKVPRSTVGRVAASRNPPPAPDPSEGPPAAPEHPPSRK